VLRLCIPVAARGCGNRRTERHGERCQQTTAETTDIDTGTASLPFNLRDRPQSGLALHQGTRKLSVPRAGG
jgi:hypothetical protein